MQVVVILCRQIFSIALINIVLPGIDLTMDWFWPESVSKMTDPWRALLLDTILRHELQFSRIPIIFWHCLGKRGQELVYLFNVRWMPSMCLLPLAQWFPHSGHVLLMYICIWGGVGSCLVEFIGSPALPWHISTQLKFSVALLTTNILTLPSNI